MRRVKADRGSSCGCARDWRRVCRARAFGPAVLWAALVVILCAAGTAGAVLTRFEFVDENRVAQVDMREVAGIAYFRLSDVALSVSGVRYWNPRTGKMTLSVGEHHIAMAPGSRFAALDRSVENLSAPPIVREGTFWVPQGFLSGVLASTLNADVEWRASDGVISIERLRPAVGSLALRQSSEGTLVDIGLTSRADFSVLSRTRGTVEVFLTDARLPDSLSVRDDTEYISGVLVEESPEGVRVEIAATDRAGSYSAEFRRNPARIEVLVRGGFEPQTPSPQLRDVKHLLPGSDDVFGTAGLGIETVMIDPGHGGSDHGSVGRGGLEEKAVTLALARKLSEALQRKGLYAFMTRSSDSHVPIERRTELANLADADIFVSLQCGAWVSGWARGFNVCYYEPPSSSSGVTTVTEGRGLPRIQTARSVGAADELLWTRRQEDHIAESRALARAVREKAADALPLRDRGIGRRSLGVLSGCAVPAIQIELGYITNRDEEALLQDEGFLRDAARAIADGIAAYTSAAEETSP